MPGRFRFTVFPEWPEQLLVTAPEDEEPRVLVIEVEAPFTLDGVKQACRAAGVDPRVMEGRPGRWTQSMLRAKSADRAERVQRQLLEESQKAVMMRSSPIPETRTRAEAILRKNAVDEKLRSLRGELDEARRRYNHGGQGMSQRMFHEKHRELGRLKQESQALQVRLGKLREAEKARNHEAREQAQDNFLEHFKQVAFEQLDKETFYAFIEEADRRSQGGTHVD